ncbi:MAG: polysaccharide deacetylase family protein [Bacteroidota bacterium]
MKNVQVLMYHRVCSDDESVTSPYALSRNVFRRQMEYLLAHGYRVLRIADLITQDQNSVPSGERGVLITFDDGYLDNYENAFPVLQEFGFTACISLVADFNRRRNWWDRRYAIMKAPLLRPDQISEMVKGGIEFGTHTINHPSLPSLGERELEQELIGSKHIVEDITGKPVRWLAYPYGDVNSRVKRAARKAGYSCGFAVNSGPLHFESDLYEIRRICIVNNASSAYLLSELSGFRKTFRWGRWAMKRLVGGRNKYHNELSPEE